MIKLASYLENIFLINFSIFLLLVPYSRRVSKISICTGAVLWMAVNIIKHKQLFYLKCIKPNFLNKPILIFLITGLISVIFSLDPYYSQSVFFERYLPYAVFFWMGAVFICKADEIYRGSSEVSLRKVHIFTAVFIVSGFILGLGGVMDYLRFHPYRLFTSFGREIPFGMLPLYLVYYIPFCFSIVIFSKKWLRAGALLSLIFLIPCWIWQGSRDAWIAVFLALVMIAFIKGKRMAVLLILIFAVGFFFLPARDKKRAVSVISLSGYGDRPAIIEAGMRMFKEHPATGVGIGMYGRLFHKYWKPPKRYAKFSYLHIHNTYLEILTEMGIGGAAAFLWIFVVFLRRAAEVMRERNKFYDGIFLGLAGTVIAALIFALAASIITVGTQGAPLFWFLLGITAVLSAPASLPSDNH